MLINYSFDFCDWNLSLIWTCFVFVWWLGLLFEIWFCGESFPEKAQGVKFTGSGSAPTAKTPAKLVRMNFGFCVLFYVYSYFMSFRVAWYMQFDFLFLYVFRVTFLTTLIGLPIPLGSTLFMGLRALSLKTWVSST